MSKHMQRDLERLQKLVLQMASFVEQAVYRAATALQDQDSEAANAVIEGDSRIDQLENEVQEECLKILALHQPVAVDLRRISSILLISTDLERMGDLASGIAERVLHLATAPHPKIPTQLAPMASLTSEMVRRSLNAFVNSDANEARKIILLDDKVDEDNCLIIQNLIEEMKSSPDRIKSGLSLFSAVRHLERIADHATNISEDVIYLVEGEIVRHKPDALHQGPRKNPS